MPREDHFTNTVDGAAAHAEQFWDGVDPDKDDWPSELEAAADDPPEDWRRRPRRQS